MKALKWILALLAAVAAGLAAIFLGRQHVIDQANEDNDDRLQERADKAVERLKAGDALIDAATTEAHSEIAARLEADLSREPTEDEVRAMQDWSKE